MQLIYYNIHPSNIGRSSYVMYLPMLSFCCILVYIDQNQSGSAYSTRHNVSEDKLLFGLSIVNNLLKCLGCICCQSIQWMVHCTALPEDRMSAEIAYFINMHRRKVQGVPMEKVCTNQGPTDGECCHRFSLCIQHRVWLPLARLVSPWLTYTSKS